MKELEATIAHSKSASSDISGRAELAEKHLAEKEKALSEAQATLKASQESVNALDADKVGFVLGVCPLGLCGTCKDFLNHSSSDSAWEQAAALKEVEKLSSELTNLQKVNKNFEKLQKELHAATKTLQDRADKSESTLKTLKASLKAAEKSAATSQKALQAVSYGFSSLSFTSSKLLCR